MPTPERAIIEGMFMIADKDGRDVPFILNETQAAFDEALTGRDIVAKARQEGISSYVLALFTVRCLYKRNTRAVVISHDQESTERLFKRVTYYLENLRGPKPVTGFASKREYTFPKTNSMFYVGTAGARKFGRGDTITDLHCSEAAFWDNAKELFSGLSDAVPHSGTIIIESTGNGKNWFYRRVMNALEGKGRYKLHFFNWIDFKEYDLPVTPEEAERIVATLDPDLEEDYLYHKVGLTPGQILFRRQKLEEKDFDLDLFKQEYPITIDECFRSTGASIFHKVNYVQTKRWERISPELYVLEGHPKPDSIYAIGADVGAGVGSDNSVIQVVDLLHCEQVAEWASNKYPPDVFGEKLARIGFEFNEAFITVESNNHGLVALTILRDRYPSYLIFKKENTASDNIMNLGFYESTRTRPLAIGALRRLLATDLVIHSPLLKSELDTFVEKENGKLEAEEGCYDDRVMAMAVFAYSYERAMLMKTPEPIEERSYRDPFSFDVILEELRNRNKGFPIGPQVLH